MKHLQGRKSTSYSSIRKHIRRRWLAELHGKHVQEVTTYRGAKLLNRQTSIQCPKEYPKLFIGRHSKDTGILNPHLFPFYEQATIFQNCGFEGQMGFAKQRWLCRLPQLSDSKLFCFGQPLISEARELYLIQGLQKGSACQHTALNMPWSSTKKQKAQCGLTCRTVPQTELRVSGMVEATGSTRQQQQN